MDTSTYHIFISDPFARKPKYAQEWIFDKTILNGKKLQSQFKKLLKERVYKLKEYKFGYNTWSQQKRGQNAGNYIPGNNFAQIIDYNIPDDHAVWDGSRYCFEFQKLPKNSGKSKSNKEKGKGSKLTAQENRERKMMRQKKYSHFYDGNKEVSVTNYFGNTNESSNSEVSNNSRSKNKSDNDTNIESTNINKEKKVDNSSNDDEDDTTSSSSDSESETGRLQKRDKYSRLNDVKKESFKEF